jgi:AcrR family transcriptional regulator
VADAETIVAAAYRCVGSKGLAGLRMRDVAAEAGVNIATVHYHLTNKTELIRAVVELAHERFRRHATPPDDADPVRRLRAHLDRVCALLVDEPHLGYVLAEVALQGTRDPVVAEIVAVAEARWRDAVQAMLAPMPRRRSRPVAALVLLTVKGACLPPVDAADLRAACRELIAHVQTQPA